MLFIILIVYIIVCDLNHTMKEILTNKFKIKHFKKDSLIYKENDICKNIGLIISGEVTIKSYGLSGEEIIYNTIKEDGIFGNNLIFSNDKRYLGDVYASKDSEIIFINRNELVTLLKNNDSFFNSYMEKLSNESKGLHANIRLLTINSAKERFLHFLKINNNEIEYDSITSLANKLYLKRETLSRTISLLIKQKLVIKKNNKINLTK